VAQFGAQAKLLRFCTNFGFFFNNKPNNFSSFVAAAQPCNKLLANSAVWWFMYQTLGLICPKRRCLRLYEIILTLQQIYLDQRKNFQEPFLIEIGFSCQTW